VNKTASLLSYRKMQEEKELHNSSYKSW